MKKKQAPEIKEETQAKKRWASPRQLLIALIPAGAVILLDQLSKLLIVSNLRPNQWVTLIEPLLKLTYAYNYHGMFSLNYGPRLIYPILQLIAVGFVVYLLLRPQSRMIVILLGAIMGGGLGNFIDRVRIGYVIDWISMGLSNWRWATFNIADGTVVVSVTILLIRELFFVKPPKTRENPADAK